MVGKAALLRAVLDDASSAAQACWRLVGQHDIVRLLLLFPCDDVLEVVVREEERAEQLSELCWWQPCYTFRVLDSCLL